MSELISMINIGKERVKKLTSVGIVMNIISEKEGGVVFINEILPMTSKQYVFLLSILQIFYKPFYCKGSGFLASECKPDIAVSRNIKLFCDDFIGNML